MPDAVREMPRRAAVYTAGAIVPEHLRVLRMRPAAERLVRRVLSEQWMAELPQPERRRALQPQEDEQLDARVPEPHEREVP